MFEVTYFGLSAGMGILLAGAGLTGLGVARRANNRHARGIGIALVCVSAGVLVALVVGVGLDSIKSTTGDVLYQVVHFAAFYAAFATVMVAASLTYEGSNRWIRTIAWSAYGISVIVAASRLAYEAVHFGTSTGGRYMPQEPIYFLPVFVALGVLIVSVVVALIAARSMRMPLAGLGVFAALAAVGMLREAVIIPSTGEPLTDLLLAFGPFAGAALCLLVAARALQPFLAEATEPVQSSTAI